jgi:SPP1 family phage portal protein
MNLTQTTIAAIEQASKDANEKQITDIIKDQIQDWKKYLEGRYELYLEYIGQVPILKRSLPTKKINEKLVNDFRGDIVDQKVGYLFGNPISYKINNPINPETGQPKYSDKDMEKFNEILRLWKMRNSIEDLDSETGRMMGACGYGARLLYLDTNGQEKIMNLNPWEVIFIYNGTLDQVDYAIIRYTIEEKNQNGTVNKTYVEWYEPTQVAYYIDDGQGNLTLDNQYDINPAPNLFGFVPVIPFENNNEWLCDFEKVKSLIDAYDLSLSDIQNELEEFRMAYAVFAGDMDVDLTELEKMRQTGVFYLPEGVQASFLTKQINDSFLENHKKTLNENIYKFAKRVDMGAEGFSGADSSGEARKWKLVNFENDIVTSERKFAKGLRQQFKCLCEAWKKRGIKLDYEDIDFEFKRNLPVDMQYEATANQTLKGLVSEETRLGLLSFIPDPKKELEKIKEERKADALDPYMNPNLDTVDNNNDKSNNAA